MTEPEEVGTVAEAIAEGTVTAEEVAEAPVEDTTEDDAASPVS